MKNSASRIAFVFLLFFSFLSISCSSDDTSEDEQDGEYLSATIDGENYSSSLSINMTEMIGITTIIGVSDSSKGIMLQLAETSTGTYQIGGANSSDLTLASYSEYSGNAVAAWEAPIDHSVLDGEIVVTNSTENNLKGTFNFTATNSEDNSTVEVSNGKFNINF